MKTYKFTVTSAQIGAATYEPGHPRHYVADMVTALRKDGLPEMRLKSLERFPQDLQRIQKVYLSQADMTLYKQMNSEYFAEVIGIIFNQEINRIVATAQAQGKTWVTAERIMPVVNHLQQAMHAAVFETLNAQLIMHIGNKRVQNIYGHITELPETHPGENSYTIDGMKIIYKEKRNYEIVADMDNYDPSTAKTLDLTIDTETVIDFGCLSKDDGMFLPNSRAIVQTVSLESHSTEFKLYDKNSLFAKFISAIHNLLLKVCSCLRARKQLEDVSEPESDTASTVTASTSSASSTRSTQSLVFSSYLSRRVNTDTPATQHSVVSSEADLDVAADHHVQPNSACST